jgi:hypothetical protein
MGATYAELQPTAQETPPIRASQPCYIDQIVHKTI